MFKRAVLEMSAPICGCQEQRLTVALVYERNTGANLKIKCKACGTQQLVPNTKFAHVFQFDTPYPNELRNGTSSLVALARAAIAQHPPATASGTIDAKPTVAPPTTPQPQPPHQQKQPVTTPHSTKTVNPYLTNFKL